MNLLLAGSPDKALDKLLVVTTPMAESYTVEHVYRQCEIQNSAIRRHDFDAILGMDWLEK